MGCGSWAHYLPWLSLTCRSQGVSPPSPARLPEPSVEKSSQGPPVVEIWYCKTRLVGCLGSQGAERFPSLPLPSLWTVRAQNHAWETYNKHFTSFCEAKIAVSYKPRTHNHFLLTKTQCTEEKPRLRADGWVTPRSHIWSIAEPGSSPGLSTFVRSFQTWVCVRITEGLL